VVSGRDTTAVGQRITLVLSTDVRGGKAIVLIIGTVGQRLHIRSDEGCVARNTREPVMAILSSGSAVGEVAGVPAIVVDLSRDHSIGELDSIEFHAGVGGGEEESGDCQWEGLEVEKHLDGRGVVEC
jgi:hypothetical protein